MDITEEFHDSTSNMVNEDVTINNENAPIGEIEAIASAGENETSAAPASDIAKVQNMYERNVAATTNMTAWLSNLPDKFHCFLPISTEVTSDDKNLSPIDSHVYSYVNDNEPRIFVPSLRAASEIMDAIARFQIKLYSIIVNCRLSAVMVSNSKEYGGWRVKESMIKKAVGNTRNVTKAMNDLENLKRGCVDAFVRAVTVERSPINTCFSAWAAGFVGSMQMSIRRMVDKYGSASKYTAAGMHLSSSDKQSRSVFIKSINDRLGKLKLDTATTKFNDILAQRLQNFITEANKPQDITSPYRNTLRQTRYSPCDTDPSVSLGMLTPRESIPNIVSNDRRLRRPKEEYESDEQVARTARAVAPKKRPILSEKDVAQTLAGTTVRVIGSHEWSMHITQLFTQAFLESITTLLSQSFEISDPFSPAGFDSLGEKIVETKPSLTSRRIKTNASILVDNHLLGVGNFYINFVVAPDDDIVNGKRVSLNIPVLAAVTTDADVTKVHLTDRLLVNNPQIEKALSATDNNTRLTGCAAVIYSNNNTTTTTTTLFESLAVDWFHTVASLGATGKIGAAVAAGVLTALGPSSKLLVDKDGVEIDRRHKTTGSTVRHSMALLSSVDQSLSAWGHSGHNDSLANFWSQSAAVRSLADQSVVAGKLVIKPASVENAERTMRRKLLSGLVSANSFDPLFLSANVSSDNKNHLHLLARLPKVMSDVFNIKGFRDVLERFRLPLVRKDKKNMRALEYLMSALGNMTLQSVVNAMGDSPMVVEETRMKALARMSDYQRNRALHLETGQSSNVVIPTSTRVISAGTGFGETNDIILPVAILSRLITDKIKLDKLCELYVGGSRLNHNILDLVKVISGSKNTFYDLFTPDNLVSFVSYLWFTTAIVSLTDTNAVRIIDVFSNNLGASIYRDFMAVRELVDRYYKAQVDYTTAGIVKRHLGVQTSKHDPKMNNLEKGELETVLSNLISNLAAFTTDRETSSVTPLGTVEDIKKLRVRVTIDSNLSFLIGCVKSLVQIAQLLKPVAEKHRKESSSNVFSPLNFERLVEESINVSNIHLPVNEYKEIDVEIPAYSGELRDIDEQIQEMKTQQENLMASASQDDDEIAANVEAIATNLEGLYTQRASFRPRIEIPPNMSATTLLCLAKFIDPESAELDLLAKNVTYINDSLKPWAGVDKEVNEIPKIVQHLILLGMWIMEATAGSENAAGVIIPITNLVLDLEAETTLVISRKQKTFAPIPPAAFCMNTIFSPKNEIFAKMCQSFLATTVNQLTDTGSVEKNNDDSLTAESIKLVAERYNNIGDDDDDDGTTTPPRQIILPPSPGIDMMSHLANPIDVFSERALPHFDRVVKVDVPLSLDNSRRLSAIYQGMSILPSNANPGEWDNTLSGNMSGSSLPRYCSSSFNSALDSLIAKPKRTANVVARELVNHASTIIGQQIDIANALDDSLGKGKIAVMDIAGSTSGDPALMRAIKEMTYTLAKQPDTSATILESWNTLSALTWPDQRSVTPVKFDHNDDLRVDKDMVRENLTFVPAFKRRLLEATRSIYDMCAVTCILSDNNEARKSARKILSDISERMLSVLPEIRVGQISNLISALASPSQYRHFLEVVANEKRRRGGRIDDSKIYALGRVYDGGLEELGLNRYYHDKFWKDVYDSDYQSIESEPESSKRIFRSVVNTYAKLASDPPSPTKHNDAIKKIAEYVIELDKDSKGEKTVVSLIDAEKCYSQISTAMTNAALGYKDGDTRHEADSILAALLRELAPRVYIDEQTTAMDMALMSRIIAGKVILSSIPAESPFINAYQSFLGAAGVTAHANKVIMAIFKRLRSSDVTLFLGGSILQRGLFMSFFLSGVLFGCIDPKLATKDLSSKARSQLFKLVGFCGALHHLFSGSTRGSGASDVSIASAVSKVYETLRKLKGKPSHYMLSLVRDGGFAAATPAVKKHSSLNDVLNAGSLMRKSWLVSYAERASKSRLSRSMRRRQLQNKIATGDTTVLDCFNGELQQVRNNNDQTQGYYHWYASWDCEDVLMDSDGEDNDDDAMSIDSDNSDWEDLSDIDDDDDDDDPLRHMGRFLHSADDSDSDDDDDDDDDDDGGEDENEKIRRKRAENVVYGPGFLTSSLESSKGLLQQIDDSSDDDDDDDDDDNHSKRKEQIFRLMRQFAPKEFTLENGRITNVTLSDKSKLVSLLHEYRSLKHESERKKMREDHDIKHDDDDDLPEVYMSRRVEKPRELRTNLVKNTAKAFRVLDENTKLVHQVLFPSPSTTTETWDKNALFRDKLDAIIKKRDDLVKNVALTSPTMFGPFLVNPPKGKNNGGDSAPPGLPMVSVDAARDVMKAANGYLAVPVATVSCSLFKQNGLKDFTIFKDSTKFHDKDSVRDKKDMTHLDWLTVSALTLGRSFRITTSYALDELIRSRNVLNEMRGSLETLIASPENQVKVRSTLIDDIFNTRMAHIDAILGLTSPTVFMNQPLPSGGDRKSVEAQALLVFRGVNSGQLLAKENAVTDTASLLDFVSSPRRMGSRVGMSLYNMSVTENLLGHSRDNRLKGAVSLEVGGDVKDTCIDEIFCKRSDAFKKYCLEVGFSPAKAMGPIHRFLPTGTMEDDTTVSVMQDPAYHRLASAENDPGEAVTMSAVGNLYGMIDTISRLSARCVEAAETLNVTGVDSMIKKLHERTKSQLKISTSRHTLAPTNKVPVFSDTVLANAMALRSSITTLLNDVNNRFDGNSGNNPKTTMRKFGQLVENIVALGHHKTHLSGVANRLAAAQYELEKLERMHHMGLSESIGAFVAVATTMGPYSAQEDKNNAKTWLEDCKLIKVLVGRELYNIRAAHQVINRCISGIEITACHLEQLVKSFTGSSSSNVLPSTPIKCGGFVTRPETQMLLGIDGEQGEEEEVRGRGAIKEKLTENRLVVAKARLAALRFGRPEIGTIFSVGNNDLDRLIASLTKSISTPIEKGATTPTTPPPHLRPTADLTEAGIMSSKGVAKSMSYIPVMFDNKYRKTVVKGYDIVGDVGRQLLRARESRDLASILNAHSRHKFGGYNQAAIATIFGTTTRFDCPSPEGLFAGFASDDGGTLLQLPPTPDAAAAVATVESKVKNLVDKLKENGTLDTFEEYEQLQRVREQVDRAQKSQDEVMAVVLGGDLIIGGGVLNEKFRTNLASMLAAKADAEQGFKQLLVTLNDSSASKDEEGVSFLTSSQQPPSDSEIGRLLKSNRIRAPLLLAHPAFSAHLRDVVNDLGKYYKGLDNLSEAVKVAIEKAVETAEAEAKQSIDLDSSNIIPAFAQAKLLLQQELDAVQSARAEVKTTITEINGMTNTVQDSIDDLDDRINTGNNKFPVAEFLALTAKYTGELAVKQQMKAFAERHSGAAFQVDSALLSHGGEDSTGTLLMTQTANAVRDGQAKLDVDFTPAIDMYPEETGPGEDGDKYTLSNHRSREERRKLSLTKFSELLQERENVLDTRVEKIRMEMDNLEVKRQRSRDIFLEQFEKSQSDLKNKMEVITQTIRTHVGTERAQAANLIMLGTTVDQLLSKTKATETVTGVDAIRTAAETVAATTTPSSSSSIDNALVFKCFLEPLHGALSRLNADNEAPLNTLVKQNTDVLNKFGAQHSDKSASKIVPGICEMCAMLVFNLHTAIHVSDHKFSFDGVASRERMRELLEAALSASVEDRETVHDRVLSIMEGNNGSVKNLSFTLKQVVACFTPVNTPESTMVWPNTVLLPTSELFDCPSIAYDKFRSMATRAWDPIVASSSKQARSIIGTLARTTPAAESLYYPCKDERRFFNSICDGIIQGMGSRASSVFNTTCNQAITRSDPRTGLPVFVGRQTTSSEPDQQQQQQSSSPAQDYYCFDMGSSFIVAPGANLNRLKEERLRMSNLSDLNNVRHLNANVHLAASSVTNRITEVLQSAVGDESGVPSDVTRSLLLGSVASLVAEKSASSANDPSILIESYKEAQTIADQTIGRNSTFAVEELFATQLAYRHRLFPAQQQQPMIGSNDFLDRYTRYRTAKAATLEGGGKEKEDNILADRFEENPRLLAKVRGLLSDKTRTRMSADTDRLNDALSMVQNKLLDQWNTKARPNMALFASSLSDASAKDRSDVAANLAVDVMTDSLVDTLSVLSAATSGHGTLPPHAATNENLEAMKKDVERVSTIVGSPSFFTPSSGASAFSVMLSNTAAAAAAPPNSQMHTSATRHIFERMHSNLEEATARLNALVGSGGRRLDEIRKLSDSVSSMALRLNEETTAADLSSIRNEIDARKLRESLHKVKRVMGVTTGSRSKTALSSLLDRDDVARGRLYPSAIDKGDRIASGIDEFNSAALLSRYVALDREWSPLPLSRETQQLLQQPKTTTAKALLSERSDLLTELVMYNTRDSPIERAVDRILLQPYLVQHAKRFDNVDPTFPLALAGSTHSMLSAMDVHDKPRSLLANLKLHLTDTSCFFKNIERFEKLTARHGDSYAMTHHQNCNCPFQLHHDFRPSVDESLVPSFAYARPEITREDVCHRPYQAQNLLNDKHYVMAITKVDPTITGAAILRRVSEWSEMGAGSRYVGTFEPSRATLSNATFKTAGVNLDVIVRPNNAKGVLGILGCHRQHVCGTTAKLCATTSMPSAFKNDQQPGHASDMLQMALPHNVYVQKSKMNASASAFAHLLEQTIEKLGREIVSDLADALLVGESSIASTCSANAATALASLADLGMLPNNTATANAAKTKSDDGRKHVRLMDQAMREMACRTIRRQLMSDQINVPFADASASSLSFDFLTDDGVSVDEKIEKTAAGDIPAVDDVEHRTLLNQLSIIFTAISQEVDNAQFVAILDNLEARIAASGNNYERATAAAAARKGTFVEAMNAEFSKVIAFMRVLKTNVIPILNSGPLAKKVAQFLSLLSAQSRLENFLRFALSNSGSTDLSHLQPLTKTVQMEDTLLYSKVHPLLVMALPKNCAALLQQEQTDPALAIGLRKPLATFLNHPNTKHMARSARAAIGAGGGHALGLFPSSLVLHEMTIATSDPAIDANSSQRFHSADTQDPLVVINPFNNNNNSGLVQNLGGGTTKTPCQYVQVSMPTQFSGVVTNTSVNPVRTDHQVPPTTVLCTDAVSNMLDAVSRTNVSLENIDVRFGFMPELVTAIAAVQNKSERAIIDSMVAAAAPTPRTTMDPITGDIILTGGTFPTPETLTPSRVLRGSDDGGGDRLTWGAGGKLEARLLPRMFSEHPLAIASVNGVPLTQQGRKLASEKGSTPVFEGLLPSGGILYTDRKPPGVAHKQLEPLRASWNELAALRNKITQKGVAIRNYLKEKGGGGGVDEKLKEAADELHGHYEMLTNALRVVTQETENTVAVSDLMLGGSGGDPAMALLCPVKPQQFGIVGVISSSLRDAFADSRTKGVSDLNDAFRKKLVLGSAGGRIIPEHGLTYGLGEDLLDASILEKKGRAISNILPTTSLTKIAANAIVGGSTGSEMKRQAIEQVLLSNDTILEEVVRVTSV